MPKMKSSDEIIVNSLFFRSLHSTSAKPEINVDFTFQLPTVEDAKQFVRLYKQCLSAHVNDFQFRLILNNCEHAPTNIVRYYTYMQDAKSALAKAEKYFIEQGIVYSGIKVEETRSSVVEADSNQVRITLQGVGKQRANAIVTVLYEALQKSDVLQQIAAEKEHIHCEKDGMFGQSPELDSEALLNVFPFLKDVAAKSAAAKISTSAKIEEDRPDRTIKIADTWVSKSQTRPSKSGIDGKFFNGEGFEL